MEQYRKAKGKEIASERNTEAQPEMIRRKSTERIKRLLQQLVAPILIFGGWHYVAGSKY